MGMTMTQKILAAHAGLDHVEAGQLIEAKLDIVMANDITGPMALPIIKQMSDHVFDKDKVVFVPDHFTPNKDIKSAENSKAIREYAKEQGLKGLTTETGAGQWGTALSMATAFFGLDCKVYMVRIPTPVHTERWELFPPVWEQRTWRQVWQPEKSGLRCQVRSSSC